MDRMRKFSVKGWLGRGFTRQGATIQERASTLMRPDNSFSLRYEASSRLLRRNSIIDRSMVNFTFRRPLGALWRVLAWSRDFLSHILSRDGIAPAVRLGSTRPKSTSAQDTPGLSRTARFRWPHQPRLSLYNPVPSLQAAFSTATNLQHLTGIRPTEDTPPPSDVAYPILPLKDNPSSSISSTSSFQAVEEDQGIDEIPVDSTRPDVPPHVPLSFKIPSHLKSRIISSDSSIQSGHWRYGLYRGPNGEQVKVHYCSSTESTERVARLFLDDRVLGFDMEWKASSTARHGIKKNVALIQLANESRIALFHVAVFQEPEDARRLVPPTLRKIIESPEITKIGIAIKADCTRLRNFLELDPRGLFELSHLHRLVKYSSDEPNKVNKILVSLAEQVEEHLGMPIWKGDEVRSGDWTKPLNSQQMHYAASDAYAVLHLYDVLEGKRKGMDPIPPHPAHAELNLPIRLNEEVVVAEIDAAQMGSDAGDSDDEFAPGEEVEQAVSRAVEIRDASSTSPTISVTKMKSRPPTNPLVGWANSWVVEYHSRIRPPAVVQVSRSQLRAYALWHCHGHSVEDIASLLRDPPLQRTTVGVYIMEAVRVEKLAYDVDRLRSVLESLPLAHRRRYLHLLGNAASRNRSIS